MNFSSTTFPSLHSLPPTFLQSVISSHSQKTVFCPCRQRSGGEAIRAERVLVPPPPGAAASLSGQGLNNSCYCCWWNNVVQSGCNGKAMYQHSAVHHRCFFYPEAKCWLYEGIPSESKETCEDPDDSLTILCIFHLLVLPSSSRESFEIRIEKWHIVQWNFTWWVFGLRMIGQSVQLSRNLVQKKISWTLFAWLAWKLK